MRIDPFFEKQPPIEFIESLKLPVHTAPPPNFKIGKGERGEICALGAYIKSEFPDGDGLLETAYADFDTFLGVCKIDGNKYPITLKREAVSGYESYRISVTEEGCTVCAEDTEGIRRALVYIEDEMTKREGPYLAKGELVRTPKIKDRITRGFFSPTNRPPKYGDELLDEVDYYPDEYLNRLAHSGTNGLWIYTSFRALIKTKYFDCDSVAIKKRIEKLTRVVAKCKKYGVKVYIFAIEPHGLEEHESKEHPEFRGADIADRWYPVCLRTDAGRDYILTAVEGLFRAVPDLGGYIDITAGERPTSCPSVAAGRTCPRCSRYSRGENLAYSCDVIKEGIRRAGTGAKFVSWTYGHRYWDWEDIKEYTEKSKSDVILMQNFEDRGYDEQLGKMRAAYDYWLSYIGPSELYEKSAKWAGAEGREMWAKMQVCTSHEIATVPYIPAPGLIFEKYKAAVALGTTGVMECWYFGNYPSVMSRASGELSFADNFDDKAAFLYDFAARVYGKTLAKSISAAWVEFENGYRSYPTNIMFSYYGPMHDGVVWELSLKPKNNSQPRTWLLLDPPDGDRIGESLFAGHTLDEAIILAGRMKEHWNKGLSLMPKEAKECLGVAECIGTLFESGYNILNFYKLRGELGRERGDAREILTKMRELVLAEKQNSEKMIALCESDKRLGYHSEAEGFKFFPEKLRDRIKKLDRCLDEEFTETEERIEKGQSPLGYYYAEGERAYLIGDGDAEGDKIALPDGHSFSVRVDGDELVINVECLEHCPVGAYLEFEPGLPECGVVFGKERRDATYHIESYDKYLDGLRFDSSAISHGSAVGPQGEEVMKNYSYSRTEEGGKILHTLRRKIPTDKWNKKGAIRIKMLVDGKRWIPAGEEVYTLGKREIAPDEYAFFILATDEHLKKASSNE
ncbi:MAG: hypothetical protein J6Q85_00835 [Clostridia bacterium]|nr:hypothetical protein [Clostridia bacterium]